MLTELWSDRKLFAPWNDGGLMRRPLVGALCSLGTTGLPFLDSELCWEGFWIRTCCVESNLLCSFSKNCYCGVCYCPCF